jgi:hypothetical protein
MLEVAGGKEMFSIDVPNFSGVGPGGECTRLLAFSPGGKLLAFPGPKRTIVLVRTDIGKQHRALNPGQGAANVAALAFSRDGRTLAVASGDDPRETRVELWEVASGQLRTAFPGMGRAGVIVSVAWSPDSLTLASGSTDTTVILWDAGGLHGQKPLTLTPEELDADWASFAKPDGEASFRSQRRMLLSPAEAVAFLKKRLRPVTEPAVDAKEVETWLQELDSDDFDTRDRAFRALEKLGVAAEPALRKARTSKLRLEALRRVDDLLGRLERMDLTGDELAAVRAVEVLERIATPASRAILEECAAGAPGAILTREAKTALGRLAR